VVVFEPVTLTTGTSVRPVGRPCAADANSVTLVSAVSPWLLTVPCHVIVWPVRMSGIAAPYRLMNCRLATTLTARLPELSP